MEYVVAAYAVLWVLLVFYVVSIGMRTARLARQAELLTRLVGSPDGAATGD